MQFMHILPFMSVLAQIAFPSDGSAMIRVELPSPDTEVLPGHPWGDAGGLFTPAYWAANSHLFAATQVHATRPHRLGCTLLEETCACLLGGYGMPAELGLAAFWRLRDERLLVPGTSRAVLEEALSTSFHVAGRSLRYRFPKQKARYLAACLRIWQEEDPNDLQGRSLRDWLTRLPGAGPKTASWIVRNWEDADDVAILDVHIVRAMQLLTLVCDTRLPRDYARVEAMFLAFADALGVRASILDAVMWQHMRRWGHLAKG